MKAKEKPAKPSSRPTLLKRVSQTPGSRDPSPEATRYLTPFEITACVRFSHIAERWVSTITPTRDEPDQEAVEEGQNLFIQCAADAADKDGESEPWDVRKEFSPILPNLLAAVGAVVGLVKYSDIHNVCGLTYTQCATCAAIDKKGFKVLWDAAKRERESRRAESYKDILAERIATGTERPIVLRNGRDHDEISMVKIKNDSLLAKATELAVAAPDVQIGPSVNIGSQVNFISPRLPDSLKAAKTINAEVSDERRKG